MFDICRKIINQYKTCVDVSEEIFARVKYLYKGIRGVYPDVRYVGNSECEEYKFNIDGIGMGYFGLAIVLGAPDEIPYISIFMHVGTVTKYDHNIEIDINICDEKAINNCDGKIDDDGSDIIRLFNGTIDIINNVCKEYKQNRPEKDDVEKPEISTDNEMTDSEFQDKIDNLYPLCIISDRYGGCYSGGNYTAWTTGIDSIPEGVFDDDVECCLTWNELKAKRNEHKIVFGVGNTPNEALRDLIYWNEKLPKEDDEKMKIFIAQKMTGLTDEQIEEKRNRIASACSRYYGDDVIILDQFHLEYDVPEDVTSDSGIGIYLLGRSLQILAKADLVVFDDDISTSKGSLVEEFVTKTYNIPTITYKELRDKIRDYVKKSMTIKPSDDIAGLITNPSFPKKVARITVCGAINVDIDDHMGFVKPTPEQIKNLHDTFCIDVKLFDEEE